MKLSELMQEGLRGNWSVNRIHDLTAKQLGALKINATTQNDNNVLKMIKQVEDDRYEMQRQAAEDDRIRKREEARRRDPVKSLSEKDINRIAFKIEQIVSEVFPDGDPIDKIAPWLKNNFDINNWDITKILDKAVKVLGKYKGYHEYLANQWDSYTEMYLDANKGLKDMHPDNPWK